MSECRLKGTSQTLVARGVPLRDHWCVSKRRKVVYLLMATLDVAVIVAAVLAALGWRSGTLTRSTGPRDSTQTDTYFVTFHLNWGFCVLVVLLASAAGAALVRRWRSESSTLA